MAQGIFGKNVLGARPQGLMGLGASYECNPSDPTYDPQWCAQNGGSAGPAWTSQCVFSPFFGSDAAQALQRQMANRGTNLQIDGLWGPCSEEAYRRLYGTQMTRESIKAQGIQCTSFNQFDEKGTQGRAPNPAKCTSPFVITPTAPPQVDVPPAPPVIPETPPSCIGPGMKLDPSTLQCVLDEVICPAGQYVGQDNLCHDIKVTCPAHKVPGPNGCMDMPAPPTGIQLSQLRTIKVPSVLNMDTGEKMQAPSSAPKLSAVPLKSFNFANLTSAPSAPAAAVQSSGMLKMPTLRTIKLPGTTEPQKQKLDPVTGQWVEDTSWISGIPNWLVVVAALAAAGGGYYYYQKKHKSPRK